LTLVIFVRFIREIMTHPNQSNTPLAAKDFAELVGLAREALSDGQLTFGEVVLLGGQLAGKVNQYGQLSGTQKQEIVLRALEDALKQVLAAKDASLPPTEQEAFRQKVQQAVEFAKSTLPAVLTVAVQAARGQLDLKKIDKVAVAKGCWQAIQQALRCAGVQAPVVPLPVQAAATVAVAAVVSQKVPTVDEALSVVPPGAGLTVRRLSKPGMPKPAQEPPKEEKKDVEPKSEPLAAEHTVAV
jgi:hypothetical protein